MANTEQGICSDKKSQSAVLMNCLGNYWLFLVPGQVNCQNKTDRLRKKSAATHLQQHELVLWQFCVWWWFVEDIKSWRSSWGGEAVLHGIFYTLASTPVREEGTESPEYHLFLQMLLHFLLTLKVEMFNYKYHLKKHSSFRYKLQIKA